MFGSDKKPYIIIRAAIFVAVFVLLFAFLEALTYDHNLAYDGWPYVYESDIDILIMGSSQADVSFDASLITDQTGKNTVVLSSGAQSSKQVYFNLVEVLKHQNPELVVVEEFSFVEDTLSWMEEMGTTGLALANLDGMRMSFLKLRAAFSTLGFEGYGVFHIMREAGKTERFLFTLRHLKLEISRIFTPRRKPMLPTRGSVPHIYEDPGMPEEQFVASIETQPDESFELTDENIKYMEKIIKLCKNEGIKLEFIKTPLIKNESSISGHAAIERYLNEKGYDIAAYNLMDTKYNIEMTKDDYIDVNHVSKSGMLKVTDWFTDHINGK